MVASAVATTGIAAGDGLPALNDKPWSSSFVKTETRAFEFRVACNGQIVITPLDTKGKAVSFSRALKVEALVEETAPGGKVVAHQPNPASLTSTDKPLEKAGTVKFAGKVSGDAAFEVTVSTDGKTVRVGGRLTDPGKAKNPQRFIVRTTLTEPYKGSDVLDKEFQRRIKKDEMRVERIGGKPDKLEFGEPLDTTSEEVNGKEGLSLVRFEMDAYRGRRFEFTADEGSSLRLSNKKKQALADGFSIDWTPDPAKDPEGKKGVTIEVK
jgi:hypothetical protein